MKRPILEFDNAGLTTVISGGQCGIDRAGLEVAREFGLMTGGTAPKGWRTWYGPDPELEKFGLVEHYSDAYPPRTEDNVKNSDATIILGTSPNSGGSALTAQLCRKHKRPYLVIQLPHTPEDINRVVELIKHHAVDVLNVAGNRDVHKNNPENFDLGCAFLRLLFSVLNDENLLNTRSINNFGTIT